MYIGSDLFVLAFSYCNLFFKINKSMKLYIGSQETRAYEIGCIYIMYIYIYIANNNGCTIKAYI